MSQRKAMSQRNERVLLITNIFPPAVGGPATFGVRLARELAVGGHTVRVATSTPADTSAPDSSFTVVRVGQRGNAVVREADRRVRLLRHARWADRIYVMGMEHQAAWACRQVRKPYTVRIGGDVAWERARLNGATWDEPETFYRTKADSGRRAVAIEIARRRHQLDNARRIVFVSDYLRRLSRFWGCRDTSGAPVVYNGVEPAPLHAPRTREHRPLRLIFVGRHTNWKGVDAALLALAPLTDVTLTIAGEGPEQPLYRDLVKRLALSDRVDFVGAIPGADVIDRIAHHDGLVLPSLYEGCSNTLLEAGMAGVACVCSDRGGNPEIIEHGRTGLLVDPMNVLHVRAAIERLRDDEALRSALAHAHQKRVAEAFTIRHSVNRTIDALMA